MTHKRKVDKYGTTRLLRESEKGDLEAVKAAYQAAPDELDQADHAGITPLQKAALEGWKDVVEFLLEQGCRTDCQNDVQDTPLIDAVENGHLEIVRLLLNQARVNPHHQNRKGQRAIDVLDPDMDDHDEFEKVLKEAMMRQPDAKDEESSRPGFTQQKPASRLLYNEFNTETLIEKAGDGDIAAVGELINSNIKPNIACGVAASRGGHYDILSILLASGLKADPDPSKHSETPMLVAIGRGHLKIVQLLLEQDNFNPTRRNREGKTYWEISEERRGPKWEQERDMLRKACEDYQRTHKSPKRTKKDPPHLSVARKRRASTNRRERSVSPRQEPKHAQLHKSSSVSQVPTKSRRLISGKEMANREVKRRRRVVSEDSSEDDGDDEVRPPAKKVMAKPTSYIEGEEPKPVKKQTEPYSEGNGILKKSDVPRSDTSDIENRPQPQPKIRTRLEKVPRTKHTLTSDAESPDERKPVNKVLKSHVMDDRMTNRRPSDVSMDESHAKRTPTPSVRSTPAPPDKESTPDLVRERRQEADRQALEAKRKAAEAETRIREEQELARKAAAEEELRRKALADADARRLAEEVEAARKRREEEARRIAEEEEKRREEFAARERRISRLPRALRRACEMGKDRPLHFSGDELGISAVFLPLFYATSEDLLPNEHQHAVCKSYIMSFQAVGILGLPELDLAHLGFPYCAWERIDVSRKQRELFLQHYDVALLAQDFRFPMEGAPDFDFSRIQESVKEARQQFLDMEGLYWIEDTALCSEVEMVESLRPLLHQIKDPNRRWQLRMTEPGAEGNSAKKQRPRKSFMDAIMELDGANGTTNDVEINGDG
jgi:ankyrin repeat protein